jgi:hypothetical protein
MHGLPRLVHGSRLDPGRHPSFSFQRRLDEKRLTVTNGIDSICCDIDTINEVAVKTTHFFFLQENDIDIISIICRGDYEEWTMHWKEKSRRSVGGELSRPPS